MALHSGELVPDDDFDRAYPARERSVSSRFWTPYAVARRGAEMLVYDGATRVLDVGSGAGKFCIIGAATTGASFVGVEHRSRLVQIARGAAEAFGVPNATFVNAPIEAIRWEAFDAYYFFNPFAENGFHQEEKLDNDVELGRARYWRDISFAEHALGAAPVGTRVLTYHGFGGRVPPTYRLVLRERMGTNALELWLKTTAFDFVDRHVGPRSAQPRS